MPIALALAAALFYGGADFLGGLASRRTSTMSVVVWSQALGLLLLAAVLPLFGAHAVASDVAWGAACGVASAAAMVLLYRGLAIGTMGVVSPVSAVLGAAIPVIYGITLHGERPAALAYGGIAAALAAVACVSVAPGTRRAGGLPPGLAEAIGAGIAFAVFFIALAQTHAEAGLIPLLAARVTSLVLLTAGALAFGGIANVRVARPALGLVLLCGALDMCANVFYVVAAHTGLLSIVVVLTQLYPATTVVLAGIVVRERLGRWQWIGVILALGGALAIAAA
jgi:drug/metabolite transporter (DMT)-like permease